MTPDAAALDRANSCADFGAECSADEASIDAAHCKSDDGSDRRAVGTGRRDHLEIRIGQFDHVHVDVAHGPSPYFWGGLTWWVKSGCQRGPGHCGLVGSGAVRLTLPPETSAISSRSRARTVSALAVCVRPKVLIRFIMVVSCWVRA